MRALHNQGSLAFDSGDLPGALRLYDQAGHSRTRVGRPARRARARPVPGADRGRAARRGVRGGRRPAGRQWVEPVLRADVELFLALASSPAVMLRRPCPRLVPRAQLPSPGAGGGDSPGGAGRACGPASVRCTGARLAVDAERLARTLEAARSEDAPVAWLLAARAAADVGRDDTVGLLAAAARYRRHPRGSSGRRRGWPRLSIGTGGARCAAVARLPTRAGRAGRTPGHAGEHRAARPGLDARGRAGPAGAGHAAHARPRPCCGGASGGGRRR